MKRADFEDLNALEGSLWWFVGMRAIAGAVLDRSVSKVDSVLDAGCGVGGNLEWLIRYSDNANIFGIDIDPDAVEFVTEPFRSRVQVASVTGLPYPDESFSLVTSFDVLVQVPGVEGERSAIAEMFRVLKPEGTLFIRCAAYPWLFSDHDRSLNTQRRYTRAQLIARLEEAGFSVRCSTYCNFFLFPVAILTRKVLRPLGLGRGGSDVRPIPRWCDWFFRQLLLAEATLIRWGCLLPCGSSVVVVARKGTEPSADRVRGGGWRPALRLFKAAVIAFLLFAPPGTLIVGVPAGLFWLIGCSIQNPQ